MSKAKIKESSGQMSWSSLFSKESSNKANLNSYPNLPQTTQKLQNSKIQSNVQKKNKNSEKKCEQLNKQKEMKNVKSFRSWNKPMTLTQENDYQTLQINVTKRNDRKINGFENISKKNSGQQSNNKVTQKEVKLEQRKLEAEDKPNLVVQPRLDTKLKTKKEKLSDSCKQNKNESKDISVNFSKNNEKSLNKFTEEEISILNEEPLNTTNPMKATLGYIPKDEERICKFAVNGECFKKSRCRLSHEQRLTDGWTRDKDDVTIDNVNEAIEPGFGSKFQTIITHIGDFGKFYGQIISDDLETFWDFISEINTEKELTQYKKYPENLIPCLHELILAKSACDQIFLRARIIDYDEATNKVKVFFVDFGNTEFVELNNIRKWDRRLEVLPFQAICFTLNGITCKPEKNHEFKKILSNILLNNIYDAKCICYIDSNIVIELCDNQDYVLDKLLEAEVCSRFYKFNSDFNRQNRMIPG